MQAKHTTAGFESGHKGSDDGKISEPNSKPGDVAGRSVQLIDWKKAVSRFFRLKFRQFDLHLTILQLQCANELLKLLVLRKQRAIASAKATKRTVEMPLQKAPLNHADGGERSQNTDGHRPWANPFSN